MKNLIRTAAVTALSCAAFAALALPLKPLNGKTIALAIAGKEKKYHLATAAEPLDLRVDGPTRLEIVTRLALPRGENDKVQYAVVVTEGGKGVKTYKTSSEKADVAFEGVEAIPAKSRKFSLQVPEGEHTYRFAIEARKGSGCAFRFLISDKHNILQALKGRAVRLEPSSYDRVATAVVAEKLIPYYVCSRQKGVQLRVIGPTKVAVDLRLNFDASMQGKQKYSITVLEGARTVVTTPYTSTRSVGASYQDWKEVVPGKLNNLIFTVPEGEHVYKFSLDEGLAQSVSMKFSIPEKDVTNTN